MRGLYAIEATPGQRAVANARRSSGADVSDAAGATAVTLSRDRRSNYRVRALGRRRCQTVSGLHGYFDGSGRCLLGMIVGVAAT